MASNAKATEQRNPRTRRLDRKSTLEILRAIHEEDARMLRAVSRAIPALARAVDAATEALRCGSRIFYVGAGTSGRLATLDAAELPPTFGVPASRVQAVMAGGRRALTHAVEGAEDDRAQGARDLAARRVKRGDVVVGIAASGSTRYVLGALEWARRRGALTIGLTSNPDTPIVALSQIPIVVETGPEAITGSTRMKAGTAQKLVLNMLSTAVMVRLGRVYDNWMIGVALTNRKLQQRGLRILAEAAGVSVADATRALRQAKHGGGRHTQNGGSPGADLRIPLVMLKTGADAAEARKRFRDAKGDLRAALNEKA